MFDCGGGGGADGTAMPEAAPPNMGIVPVLGRPGVCEGEGRPTPADGEGGTKSAPMNMVRSKGASASAAAGGAATWGAACGLPAAGSGFPAGGCGMTKSLWTIVGWSSGSSSSSSRSSSPSIVTGWSRSISGCLRRCLAELVISPMRWINTWPSGEA